MNRGMRDLGKKIPVRERGWSTERKGHMDVSNCQSTTNEKWGPQMSEKSSIFDIQAYFTSNVR